MTNQFPEQSSRTSATPVEVEVVSGGGSSLQNAAARHLPGVHHAAGGFAQTFGLDYRVSLMMLVLDAMLFSGEALSGGALLIFSPLAGLVFGIIAYRAQKKWYGDDHGTALTKALILGLLTAVPTSLPSLLTLPAGFIGAAKNLRDKWFGGRASRTTPHISG